MINWKTIDHKDPTTFPPYDKKLLCCFGYYKNGRLMGEISTILYDSRENSYSYSFSNRMVSGDPNILSIEDTPWRTVEEGVKYGCIAYIEIHDIRYDD